MLENVKTAFAEHLKTCDSGTVLRSAIQNYLLQFAPEGLDELFLAITDLTGEWPITGQNNQIDLSKISDEQMNQLPEAGPQLIDLIGTAVSQLPQEVKYLLKDINSQTHEAFNDDPGVARNAVTDQALA